MYIDNKGRYGIVITNTSAKHKKNAPRITSEEIAEQTKKFLADGNRVRRVKQGTTGMR